MRRQIIRSASNDTTRDRILKAAMLRFSTQSYEETGLREIAADVGDHLRGAGDGALQRRVGAALEGQRVAGGDLGVGPGEVVAVGVAACSVGAELEGPAIL